MSNRLDDRRAQVDVVLTNLSIGLPTDQDYIGDQLLPPLSVPTSKAKIPTWSDEAFRIRDDRVGDFSEPEKLDVKLSTTLLEVEGHALAAPVSLADQKESSSGPLKIDLERAVLETINANMDLAREKLQADLLTTTTTYPTSHRWDVNGHANLWNNSANDPLDDILPMLETTVPDDSGKRPNVFWMGQPVWAALMMNTTFRTHWYGTAGPQGVVTPEMLGQLLGVKVLVGRAISRNEAGTVTKLWGTNAGLAYVQAGGGQRTPMFGRTVEWAVFGNAAEEVRRWVDNMPGAGGVTWIKRGAYYSPVVTFNSAGALFYNTVI